MPEPLRGSLTTRRLACGCYLDLAAETEEGPCLVRIHHACDEARRLRAELEAANALVWRAWYAGERDESGEAAPHVLAPYRAVERAYRAHFGEETGVSEPMEKEEGDG